MVVLLISQRGQSLSIAGIVFDSALAAGSEGLGRRRQKGKNPALFMG
jgi:hypothetical protein